MITGEWTRHDGLLMIKPHAYKMVLHDMIANIMTNGSNTGQLAPNDPLRQYSRHITIAEPHLVRDLSVVPYGATLLNLFYGDKATRRYYPLIWQNYLGKVTFIAYQYTGDPADMPAVFQALKGTTETYTTTGEQLDTAAGIRGLLGQPYQLASTAEAEGMDDPTYYRAFTPVVNNYIHVCDSTHEIQTALSILNH